MEKRFCEERIIGSCWQVLVNELIKSMLRKNGERTGPT